MKLTMATCWPRMPAAVYRRASIDCYVPYGCYVDTPLPFMYHCRAAICTGSYVPNTVLAIMYRTRLLMCTNIINNQVQRYNNARNFHVLITVDKINKHLLQ